MAYEGFISYSHAADGQLAPALQRGLQFLAKPWNSRRALRIFRDETGLSTNPHLWSAIERALDESEWFVLLASEEASQSQWVNKEISHWLATKAVDHILPVVTDGTWDWDPTTGDFTAPSSAVPHALRGALRDEPRHLDLRWARTETDLDLRNSRFRSAVADLAAPMHGIAKDELEGEDIRQHRRARRLARGAIGALSILVAILVAVSVFAFVQRNSAQVQSLKSDAERTGTLAQTESDLDLSLLLAVAGVKLDNLPETRGDLLAALQRSPAALRLIRPSRSEITALAISPNGRLLATGDAGGVVRFENLTTWKPSGMAIQLPGPVAPRALRFSPDGATVAVASGQGSRSSLTLVDVKSRHSRLFGSWVGMVPASPAGSTAIAYSADGSRIAVGLPTASPNSPTPLSEQLLLLDGATGRVRWKRDYPMLPGQWEAQLAFAADGTLVTSVEQGMTDLWDVSTGRITRQFPIGGRFALSPTGKTAAIGLNSPSPATPTTSVAVLDLGTGTSKSLQGVSTATWMTSLTFTPDGKSVVGGSFDGDVRVWDLTSGSIVQSFVAQPGSRIQVAVDPSGRTALSGADDGSVVAWDLLGNQSLGRTFAWNSPALSCPMSPCLVVNPRSTLMASDLADGTVALVDLHSLQLSATIPAKNSEIVNGLAFAPDGHTLVTGDVGGDVIFWDTRPIRSTRTLHMSAPVSGLTLSPDGRLLAVQMQPRDSSDSEVELLKLANASVLRRYRVPYGSGGVAFSADGRELAALGCCSAGSKIDVWDVASGSRLFSPKVEGQATAIAFSSAALLGAGTADGKAILWDARSGAPLGGPLQVSASGVAQISFSPNGSLLAAGSGDGTTILLDVRSRQRVGNTFAVNQQAIPVPQFEPNGDLIIVYAANAAQWPTDLGTWERYACQVAGRDLTRTEWFNVLPGRPYQHVCPT